MLLRVRLVLVLRSWWAVWACESESARSSLAEMENRPLVEKISSVGQ